MSLKRTTKYLVKYTIPGIITFGIDLALLWIFLDFTSLHYIPAAVLAFSIGTSINYVAAHQWVFNGTKRGFHEGYVYFMVLSTIGVVLTAGIMALFVEVIDLKPLPARLLTAAVVGLWNFGMNYFINFKMHHHHPSRARARA